MDISIFVQALWLLIVIGLVYITWDARKMCACGHRTWRHSYLPKNDPEIAFCNVSTCVGLSVKWCQCKGYHK